MSNFIKKIIQWEPSCSTHTDERTVRMGVVQYFSSKAGHTSITLLFCSFVFYTAR